MADHILEEKELSVGEYLQLFEHLSADYALVKKGSEKLSRVLIRKIQDDSGTLFEDTLFTEKSGLSYSIRTRLD